MTGPPPRKTFTAKEWNLVQRLNTPAKVQRWLSLMPYNWERRGGTMRSFREVVKRNEAHCLEASVAAAVILEQHGYPPQLPRRRPPRMRALSRSGALRGGGDGAAWLPAARPQLRVDRRAGPCDLRV